MHREEIEMMESLYSNYSIALGSLNYGEASTTMVVVQHTNNAGYMSEMEKKRENAGPPRRVMDLSPRQSQPPRSEPPALEMEELESTPIPVTRDYLGRPVQRLEPEPEDTGYDNDDKPEISWSQWRAAAKQQWRQWNRSSAKNLPIPKDLNVGEAITQYMGRKMKSIKNKSLISKKMPRKVSPRRRRTRSSMAGRNMSGRRY